MWSSIDVWYDTTHSNRSSSLFFNKDSLSSNFIIKSCTCISLRETTISLSLISASFCDCADSCHWMYDFQYYYSFQPLWTWLAINFIIINHQYREGGVQMWFTAILQCLEPDPYSPAQDLLRKLKGYERCYIARQISMIICFFTIRNWTRGCLV